VKYLQPFSSQPHFMAKTGKFRSQAYERFVTA